MYSKMEKAGRSLAISALNITILMSIHFGLGWITGVE